MEFKSLLGGNDEKQKFEIVRNSKHKQPPKLHNHEKRNPFHRDFDVESIQ